MTGDPSGRESERDRISSSRRENNTTQLTQQLNGLFLNVDDTVQRLGMSIGRRTKMILNNFDWFHKTSAVEILGTLPLGMNLAPMLGRDS